MKNVTYIVSNINKALAFEWVAGGLDKNQFNLSFVLLNPNTSELEVFLKSKNIPVKSILYRGKKDLPKALWQTIRTLRKYKTDLIHTHLFDASLIGLMAGKILGIRKRIYTRHYATYHHEYFPKGVKYDKLINRLATDIIAISQNVKSVLIDLEKVNPQKIHVVYHGFQLSSFQKVPLERIEQLKRKYKTSQKYPVIGVIARQTHLKGIQYIIPAFQKLLETYPNAYLILANAQGDYKREIDKLLSELPKNSFIEIPFENDLPALYQLFDGYVHTPINEKIEAFGQTYIEALASGIPSVFTLSGVAKEFIKDKENALVVPFEDQEAIYNAFLELINDNSLQNELKVQGWESVKDLFSLENHLQKLANLYAS